MFGADPEFFAGYEKDGQLFVLPPVYFRTELEVPYVPHPKHPKFIKQDEILWHEDGVAFELSIAPAHDWKDLFFGIQRAKELLNDQILSKFDGVCLPNVLSIPTINFDVERWKKMPDEYRLCMIFGCDRDFDAFNMEKKCEIIDALLHPYRYAGGHIHVSGNVQFFYRPVDAIKCLAETTGLAAVAYSDLPELERERTFLYGKPGKFRPQQYKLDIKGPYDCGIEYRTPSVRWTENIEHASKVFEWTTIGMTDLFESGRGVQVFDEIGNDVCKAILECDQNLALELLGHMETLV